MKKILLGMLLMAVFANSQINQRSVIGNWTMESRKVALDGGPLTLETSAFDVTDDWKYVEKSVFNVHFPEFGKEKANVKYKLEASIKGEYRIERSGIRKYVKEISFEISDASDEAIAQSSLREAERLIRALTREALPIASATDTELELQIGGGAVKFSKPKNLPISKLTAKALPFFPPDGWRYPESAKELGDFPTRLKNDKNLFTIVEADFNGDGLQDAVAYLFNDRTEQIALFMHLSQPGGSYSLEPYGFVDKNTVIEKGVFLAPAGEYTNVTSKQKIITHNAGFLIVIFNEAATLTYMDAKGEWKSAPIGKIY